MNVNKCNKEALEKAIKLSGGANELANKIGVSYTTVLAWKNGRTGMNYLNCIKIEQVIEGKVRKEEILPDYPWDKFTSEDKKDEKLEIAKKMFGMGMSKENISEATGLSIEEVEKIED